MKPVLVGSWNSPFTRRLRLLFWEKFDHEFKPINFLENKEDAAYLKSMSPTNRVPFLLLTDRTKIYDSRVIANWFFRENDVAPLTIDQENLISVVDAAGETCVNLFQLRRGGLDTAGSENNYVVRQRERIMTALDYLEPRAKDRTADHWNFATMSLYCFLVWGTFRELIDLSKHPELKKMMDRLSTAPGVQETKPR